MIEAREAGASPRTAPPEGDTAEGPTAGSSIRAVLALSRVEGRRLLTHPILLLSPLLSLTVVGGLSGDGSLAGPAAVAVSGILYFTVGWGALLVANLATLRGLRSRTEELYIAAPVDARLRIAAHMMSLAWPMVAALALNVAAAVYLDSRGPLPLETDFGSIEPFSLLILQGPAMIAAFGALGVALARWIPSVTIAPLAIVGTFMLEMPFLWEERSPLRWLAPLTLLSPEAHEPSYVMGLHVLYLVGLAALLGAIAALRGDRSRMTFTWAVGGVLAVSTFGALQVLAA